MHAFVTPLPEHTPEPWGVFVDDLNCVGIEHKNGVVVTRVGEIVSNDEPDNAIMMNDAYLMAKAPELYRGAAACMEMLMELMEAGRIDFTVEDAPYIQGWIEYTEGALAEARGEE